MTARTPVSVFIDSLQDGYDAVMQRGFDFMSDAVRIAPGDRVCIKPNLTYPTFRPGVMTNPEAVEALVRYLKNFTDRIVVCESDSGGYNPFSMDAVFQATGLADLPRRYGVRIVNMSQEPARSITVRTALRRLTVPLPTLLLDETDLFITMPVPKVHLNTVVSIAIKNQWGVIQNPAVRLKLHPYFKHVIYAIAKALPRTLCVVDGKYGLTRSGPMLGDPVDCQWLMMADDPFVTDYLVTEIMGLNPWRIGYLRYILGREQVPASRAIRSNVDHLAFRKQPFYLRRAWTDYPGLFTFKSRALAYVGYESALARPLHWLLYRFREPFY
jgi:uncharacterized protein (DUF362 family)